MTARITGAILLAALAACSTAPYRYEPFEPSRLETQAQTQAEGEVTVTVAVPGEEQAEAIFGFPIYERGIQPVWLRIENRQSVVVRYAPTGTDREYFSPLEVAYIHRKGYSKEARAEMERRLYDLGMPRHIEPGQTASGFVFTNADPGTKGVLVEVFGGPGAYHSFPFFLDVPGFVPDHAQVDFESLYEPSEVRHFDASGFRQTLAGLPCCTTDQDGAPNGLPLGAVLVGPGRDVLRALLRAGWYETAWTRERDEVEPDRAYYLFGRTPDAVFRIRRSKGTERNELHLWLAPWTLDDEPVWMAQVAHFIGRRYQLGEVLFGARLDPDMDDSRNFLMQNIWYTQGLEQLAWLDYGEAVTQEEARSDFQDTEYFTDGHRLILWLSGEPMSLLEARNANWDTPPDLRSR